jgi:hypothetical protein
MDQQAYTSDPFSPGPTANVAARRGWKRWWPTAAILVALLVAVFMVINAVVTRNSTGVLKVGTSSKNAQISLIMADQSKQIGTGSANVRLHPGTYQLSVHESAAETQKTVTVTKGETTSVNVKVQKPIALETVAPYPAQNILVDADKLFFVNTGERIPYTYKMGEGSGRPYLSELSGLNDASWLNQVKLYAFIENVWYYVDEAGRHDLHSGTDAPVANSVSINRAGAFAFTLANKDLMRSLVPGGQPQKIGSIPLAKSATQVAPNGQVLVYTPAISFGDQTAETRLYSDNGFKALPASLTGIANARWNPDSSRISYTTNSGMFIYDFGTQKVTAVLATAPTNQLSATWIDDNTLLYAQNRAIWRYSLTAGAATKVAGFDGVLNSNNPFTLAADNQTVYVGTSFNSNSRGAGIFRFLPNYYELSTDQRKQVTDAWPSATAQTITFARTNDLIPYGVTTDQINNTKYAITQFLSAANIKTDVVRFANIVPVPRNRDSESLSNFINFSVFIKEQEYKARLEYVSTSTIRLQLSNAAGAMVYDSQTIDSLNQ